MPRLAKGIVAFILMFLVPQFMMLGMVPILYFYHPHAGFEEIANLRFFANGVVLGALLSWVAKKPEAT